MPGLTSGLLESHDHPCCVHTVIFRSVLLVFLIVVLTKNTPRVLYGAAFRESASMAIRTVNEAASHRPDAGARTVRNRTSEIPNMHTAALLIIVFRLFRVLTFPAPGRLLFYSLFQH